MQLFVIRHAAAAAPRARTVDAARPLTRKGRRRWKRAVRGLEKLGLRFDRVYHSPWLRALETADALAALVDGETVVTKELTHRPTPALLEQLEGDRVALVGHQPWLGELVGLLVFGDARERARLILKEGSVLSLDGKPRPGGMTIRALLPPRVLRTLART
jgi:phosphohistidine phosphatase